MIVPRAPARGRDRSPRVARPTRRHACICEFAHQTSISCNSVTSRVLFDFWAHSRAILPRAPRQENLLRREAPSVLGPPQAPKNLASETLGAFLHGKSGVPKDISRTTTSRTTARNIPMPHPGAYVASDRETCVCAFKAFHASTFHSTAGISQNYDSLTDISQTTSASGGQPPPCSRTPGPGVTPCIFFGVRGPARP